MASANVSNFPMSAVGGGVGTLAVLVAAGIIFVVVKKSRNRKRNQSNGTRFTGTNIPSENNNDTVTHSNPLYETAGGVAAFTNPTFTADSFVSKDNYDDDELQATEPESQYMTCYPDTYKYHSIA
ncbi:uncharacterized protein LOC117341547 [Pecten maximus]|uniref:uncharacterized protein LOC117341547 n=1 Tax=Pecten maximus TaxID=6579 RepID=UPI0014580A17|nr:uncharacterized protein LOC117341547 [Pecten maximus]